ncbi:MAG TPA: PepSY domain-containing protein [Gemmataceae bacterium]
MKWSVLNRKLHYWGAFAVSVPVLVIIATGILLQLKKESHWIQPTERRGSGKEPRVSFEQVLSTCRRIPEAEIRSWADVDRIDVRPAKGILKVTAVNSWEVQIDIATGEVLQVAYRRSDLIESIHDGSWFHDSAKLWVFLPAGVALLLLWLTGMYLFILPYWVRARRRRDAARRAAPPAT